MTLGMDSLSAQAVRYVAETRRLNALSTTTEETFYPAIRSLLSAILQHQHLPFEVRTGTSEAKARGTDLPGVLVAAGDGQHPKAQHLGQAMGNQSRIASVAEATGQKIGQADAAFRLAQQYQAAVRGDQATVECRRHLLATDGWKIEGKKAIVGHGGCGKSVVRFESRLGNDFLHDFNELRYARQPFSKPAVNNAG